MDGVKEGGTGVLVGVEVRVFVGGAGEVGVRVAVGRGNPGVLVRVFVDVLVLVNVRVGVVV